MPLEYLVYITQDKNLKLELFLNQNTICFQHKPAKLSTFFKSKY